MSEILFDALANGLCAGVFTVGLGVIAGLMIDRRYRRPRFEAQERILHKLAELRTEGVGLRNRQLEKQARAPADASLAAWEVEVRDWERRLLETAKAFSPVEAERLRTLDWYVELDPKRHPGIRHLSPEARRKVSELSATLQRLDKMLEKRFRPTLAP